MQRRRERQSGLFLRNVKSARPLFESPRAGFAKPAHGPCPGGLPGSYPTLQLLRLNLKQTPRIICFLLSIAKMTKLGISDVSPIDHICDIE